MRVALTGGTGFLGSHIVDALLARGDVPVCLVRRTSDTTHLDTLGVETVLGAVDVPDTLPALVRDADAVVHTAALLKAHSRDELWRCNAEGTRALVDHARLAGVDRFVHVSSIAAKGPAPSPEPLPHDGALAPISDYGRSKAAAEDAVRAAASDMTVRIIRPPVLYGPRDMAILELFQTLARRRVFPMPAPAGSLVGTIYGPDCADAVVTALHHRSKDPLTVEPADAPGRTWEEFRDLSAKHLGLDKVRTLRPPRWLVHTAGAASTLGGKLTGRPPRFNRDKAREATQRYWVADTESMKQIDWAPEHDLDAGLAKTLAWYREKGML